MRLKVSIDFSSQEFPSIARRPHTILRCRAEIKKGSSMLRTRKILPKMVDEKPTLTMVADRKRLGTRGMN